MQGHMLLLLLKLKVGIKEQLHEGHRLVQGEPEGHQDAADTSVQDRVLANQRPCVELRWMLTDVNPCRQAPANTTPQHSLQVQRLAATSTHSLELALVYPIGLEVCQAGGVVNHCTAAECSSTAALLQHSTGWASCCNCVSSAAVQSMQQAARVMLMLLCCRCGICLACRSSAHQSAASPSGLPAVAQCWTPPP